MASCRIISLINNGFSRGLIKGLTTLISDFCFTTHKGVVKNKISINTHVVNKQLHSSYVKPWKILSPPPKKKNPQKSCQTENATSIILVH